jgi:hypothetical protein
LPLLLWQEPQPVICGCGWLHASMLHRCFIDASCSFWFHLVSSGFQVSNSVSGRAPCCQEGEAQLCVFKRGKRQCCTVMNGPSAHSASNSSIAAKLRMLSGCATAFASAFVNVYAVCSSFQKVEIGVPKISGSLLMSRRAGLLH